MQKANLIRITVIIPLLIIFMVAAASSFRAGIADLYAYSPRQHIEHWQKIGKPPSSEEISIALKKIEAAIEWQPTNAEFMDIQAVLLNYRALHHYRNNDQTGFLLTTQQSIDSYRKATQTRPNWPYSWANLALMKAAIKQFDSEYQNAMLQGAALGPWENAVNITIAEAGLLGWAKLPPSMRTSVIDNIERGIKRNNKVLKNRLSAISKLGIACIHLKNSNERKKLCGF